MHKTKLYQLLKSLSEKEFDRLEDYLASPFFNKKDPNILKLYFALKKNWRKINDTELSKCSVFSIIFPNESFNDLKMRHLLNKTVKMVDDYLLYLYNEQNELEREICVTKVYNQRNIYAEFVKNSRRLLKNLEKEPIKDTTHYYRKFILERDYICHQDTPRNKESSYFKKAIKSFHNYVALEYVHIQIDINNAKRIFKMEVACPELTYSQTLTNINKTLQINSLANQLLRAGNEETLHTLRNLFEKNLVFLSEVDRKNTFAVLLNYAIQEMSKNPTKYIPFLLEVYKLGIQHDLVLHNGEMKGNKYLNIVKVGIANKDLTWTKDFIAKNEHKITFEERNFTKNIALALLYFAEEKFEEVNHILLKTKLPEIKFSINIRTILLRSTFKLYQKNETYYQPLIHQINAFEKYLKRDKVLISKRKLKNRNFTKYLRRIIYLCKKNKWSERKKLELIADIRENKNIALNHWLFEVITEINPDQQN